MDVLPLLALGGRPLRDFAKRGGGHDLPNSKRTLDDAADQVVVRKSSLCRGGRKFRIRCQKRVWVHVDDEGRAVQIDAKIDARIAAEPEQGPGGQCELLERRGKFGLVLFQTEAPQLPL